MGRKRRTPGWGARIVALLLLAALAGGAWFWWQLRHWTPPESEYPDQGVYEGPDSEGSGARIDFRAVRALGGSFAYLDASDGAHGQDPRFARDYAAARKAGLQVGAVHRFDPCTMADGQSANFVTMVPRDQELLPPAIELDRTAENCDPRVAEAAVESELMTFINQVELHAGKPVILKVSPGFEDRYGLARRIERNLWLTRTRLQPDYAGRPWLLWTANEQLRSEASEEPVRWVVVQP